MSLNRRWNGLFSFATVLTSLIIGRGYAEDWPQLGRNGSRNAVSPEMNSPLNWQIRQVNSLGEVLQEEQNIHWNAPLGLTTFGTPMIQDGLIWIGTSLRELSTRQKYSGVLLCFRERDGKLLWKSTTERLPKSINDYPWRGLGCVPMAAGDKLWYVNNRAEVICLNIGPLKRFGKEPQTIWKLDMIKELGIFPRALMMGPSRTCSISAPYKNRIYVVTGNGANRTGAKVPAPKAPSLICLDKDSGELLWSDNSPGENILVGQFSSPLVVEIAGRGQVIVPQGDGWIRSFDAVSGKLIWKFDVNAKASKWDVGGRENRNSILATPVFYDGRVYIAGGQHPESGTGIGRLCCIDPSKSGDLSTELVVDKDKKIVPVRRIQAVDTTAGERVIANPNSGLVWEFIRVGKEFEDEMHRTLSSVVIKDNLLIAADFSGLVHCLDAKTGKRYWHHDSFEEIWSSPLIVGNKVYVTNEEGTVLVYGLSRDRLKALRQVGADYQPLAEIDMGKPCYGSPVFANETLYITNSSNLYAIRSEKAAQKPALGNARTDVTKRPVADAPFIPTPHDVVEKMLELAAVKKDDLLCDLGSGDGRIVIAAAKKYGCRAIGYELDRDLVELSREKVKKDRLEKLVTIEEKDIFKVDLSKMDVVTVFLYPRLLEKLRPQLTKLKPGTRIVSHHFKIPNAAADKEITVKSKDGEQHNVYLWTAPLKVE